MISLNLKGGKETVVMLEKLAAGGVGEGAQDALNTFALSVLALAQENSPVGERVGGTFRQSWQISENPTMEPGVVAAIEVVNNMPYAEALEYGSPQGGKPWPNAGPRTVLEEGRVWSSQAPGGVLAPELEAIAEDAAKAVTEGLLK